MDAFDDSVVIQKSVYFPVTNDGLESFGRVPRNPCEEAVSHIG